MTPESSVQELDRITLTVDRVAHGGHVVGRHEGQVVFVRHALPGERVVAEVTEVHRSYVRADAVEILAPSPDRVPPPCPYAGPGRCGGCDLQHVAPAAQRDWKATVVREQLARLAGFTDEEIADLGVRVSALPAAPDLLGWRSRVRYAVDAAGRAGLLKHRSHEVVPIERCLIAHPSIQDLPVLGERHPSAEAVETIASSAGEVVAREVPTDEPAPVVREVAVGRAWALPSDAFWQVHPAAADALANAVLELAEPRAGEVAWDLYGGAGLFAAAVGRRVGSGGRVTLVESSSVGVAAARDNLRDLPWVEVVAARVEVALAKRRVAGPVDVVVLDPPRTGAGQRVARTLAHSGARAIAYVACDPAAFARDVRAFRDEGWRLDGLRGFDCFPMTQHIELVGLLLPGPIAR